MLGRFAHVERMDEYRMARRVLMAGVSGERIRGRSTLGWMDGVFGHQRDDSVGCAKDMKGSSCICG